MPFPWVRERLDALVAVGRMRQLRPIERVEGAVVRQGGDTLVNFSGSDYLGLATLPEYREAFAKAAAAAAREWGSGSGASRLVCGDLEVHEQLEATLAAWMGTATALTFPSAYQANLAVIGALCGSGDVVFSDKLSHASLIDGARLSKARVEVWAHNDLDDLDRRLRDDLDRPHAARRVRLVVTESLFSMDGDRAPLADLAALCRKRNSLLLVDEAHAVGVFGGQGRGLLPDALRSWPEVLVTGGFGKALGSQGGFLAGHSEIRTLLINHGRGLIYSTAPSPILAAVNLKAVELAQKADVARATLRTRQVRFATATREFTPSWGGDRHRMSSDGGGAAGGRQQMAVDDFSPIQPWLVGQGGDGEAVAAQACLREAGFLVYAMRPPTVPPGTARLRICLSAVHTDDQIDRLAEALRSLPR